MILCECGVEDIVRSEYSLSQPLLSIGVEELSVEIIGDSATILHFSDHVLDSLPGVGDAQGTALSHVLVDVSEGGLEIGGVELVSDTETEGTELSSLLND